MKQQLKEYLKKKFKYIDPKVWLVDMIFQKILRINGKSRYLIHYTSQVTQPWNLTAGEGTERYLASAGNCYYSAINGIIIGKNTMIAPGVKIISANHDIEGDPEKHVPGEPVIIGDNCWLGANVVILPGVKLGNNVVVGAGSVVTRSFESNVIIAGNPAKIIRRRDENLQ